MKGGTITSASGIAVTINDGMFTKGPSANSQGSSGSITRNAGNPVVRYSKRTISTSGGYNYYNETYVCNQNLGSEDHISTQQTLPLNQGETTGFWTKE